MAIPRVALFIAILAVLFSACTTGGSDPSANIVGFADSADQADSTDPAPSQSAASTEIEIAQVASDPLGAFTEDDVLAAATEFSDVRDAIVVGDEDAAALASIASPNVIAQVQTTAAQNLANLEAFDPASRSSYTTYVDFVAVQRQQDQIVGASCSERWGQRPGGTWQISFVDEAYTFDIIDDDLIVVDVTTAHDGEPATTGLSCFSGILGERAVDGARAGIDALRAIAVDPTLAATTDFETLFGGVALDSFAPLATTADPSRRRVTPVETRYTPLGIDARSLDFIGVVSVCRFYPQGVLDEVVATGERVEVNTNYQPGTSIEDRVSVWIEPKSRVDGGVERFWSFEANVSEGCW